MPTCTNCGQENAAGSAYCANCGMPVVVAPPTIPPPPREPGAPLTGVIETSGKATASLVTGIIGLICLFPVAIAAIILGHMAKNEIKRSGGRLGGDSRATAGLVLGYLAVALIPLILIIAAIAIPNLLRSRMAANEASAVGSLRTLNTALVTYASTYGQYPVRMEHLGPPLDGEPAANAADLIDEVLAAGAKSGYHFNYTVWDTDGDGLRDSYSLTAWPLQHGTTGQRTFFTDQSGVIRAETDGVADESSLPIH
jgi:type IV pilus assembly protein PilA